MTSGRTFARRALKVSAAAYDRLRPPTRGVVVLLYHRVGARSGLEVDLPVSLFEEQMSMLSESGRAVTMDKALDFLLGVPGAPTGESDPVVVTFDDGTDDFTDVAVPILERHGVPATLYLATAFVEEGRCFSAHGRPASWADLCDALSTGLVTIGSHTHSHALLDRLSADEVAGELDHSTALIRDRLGVAADHFAYPKAVVGSAVAQAEVRSRFRSAALAGTRPNVYGRTDVFALTRSPVQVSDGLRWFERKLAGGMALEGSMRRVLDGRRYAGLAT